MELNSRILSIKQELKKQKINYIKLSELSGVPLETLRSIFSGRAKNPRIDTVEAIEQAIYFNYEKKPVAERQTIADKKSDIQLIYDSLSSDQQAAFLAFGQGLLAANNSSLEKLKNKKI